MKKVHETSKNRRKLRSSYKTRGTAVRPRLSVFRSDKFIYVQAINDFDGKTVASVSSKNLKEKSTKKPDVAKNVGLEMGKILKDLKIESCVYDRGSYKYHGRVKSLADGIREAGVNI